MLFYGRNLKKQVRMLSPWFISWIRLTVTVNRAAKTWKVELLFSNNPFFTVLLVPCHVCLFVCLLLSQSSTLNFAFVHLHQGWDAVSGVKSFLELTHPLHHHVCICSIFFRYVKVNIGLFLSDLFSCSSELCNHMFHCEEISAGGCGLCYQNLYLPPHSHAKF